MLQDVVIGFLFGGALTFGVFCLAIAYARALVGQGKDGSGYLPFSAKSERDEKRVEDTIAPWADHPGGLGR